jgi:HEAT repeat protein
MSKTVTDWIEGLRSRDNKVVKEAARALAYIGQGAVEPLILTLRDESVPFDNLVEGFRAIGTQATPPLTALLSEPDTALRQRTARLLGALKDNQAVVALVVALEHSTDGETRTVIAASLGNFTDARAVPPLLNLLQDSDHKVKAQAAKSLGAYVRDPRVIANLLRSIVDADPLVRGGAIQGLARATGDERVQAALEAAIEDKDGDVRQLAAAALQFQKGDAMAFQRVEANLDSTVMRAVNQIMLDGKVTQEDIEVMRNSNPKVRARLLEAMTATDQSSAFTLIMPGLNDINPAVRKSAVDAMVRLGVRIITLLMEAAETNKSRFVRSGSVESLGLIGDARAVPTLIKALKDAEVQVRLSAIEALGHFPAGDATIKALKETARDDDKNVREQAELMLRKFGHEPDKAGVVSRFFRRLTGGN